MERALVGLGFGVATALLVATAEYCFGPVTRKEADIDAKPDPLVYAWIARTLRTRCGDKILQDSTCDKALDTLARYSSQTSHHPEIVLLLSELSAVLRSDLHRAEKAALVMTNVAANPLSHPWWFGGTKGNDAISTMLERGLLLDACILLENLTSSSDGFAVSQAKTKLHAESVAHFVLGNNPTKQQEKHARAILRNCQ